MNENLNLVEILKDCPQDSEISGREYKRVVGYTEPILQDSKGIGD